MVALKAAESWIREQLRRKIDVEEAAAFFERIGIPLIRGRAAVGPAVGRIKGRFFESLRHHLAGGQLIRRRETQEVLAQLAEDTTRIVVVHGVAGSGKSGVLFELAQQLEGVSVPFLPLRLDRHKLKRDPQTFGEEELGLPDSPSRSLASLAREQSGVLLLDQLDALRWTSAHLSEAWDVCREIISEALESSLKVVVCCRTFDLEHDPQLRGWEQETRNLRRIEVQSLSPEDVTAAIERAAEGRQSIPVLKPKERELLRHVHHLQMWLEIYKSTESAPTFDTSWSLMRQFWANRLDELAKEGVTKERAEELERRFVHALDNGAVLAAYVRKLDISENELYLYARHHLVTVTGETFTFCHQSYQDYLVAKNLLRELDQGTSEEGGHRVVTWLGPLEKQSLFRREQLRLLLGALRAEQHQAYLPSAAGVPSPCIHRPDQPDSFPSSPARSPAPGSSRRPPSRGGRASACSRCRALLAGACAGGSGARPGALVRGGG